MSTIGHYSQIFNVGHKALDNFWNGKVTIQEKIDGSQFSFCRIGQELVARSKGALIYNPDKLFRMAYEHALARTSRLPEGWVFRAEAVCSPKHNSLVYSRSARGGIVLFDIDMGDQDYAAQSTVEQWASKLEVDYAPVFDVIIEPPRSWDIYLHRESVLGGTEVEGVVAKNYCVTPEHRTLTSSLDWVPIGDLKVGDSLLAFSERGGGFKNKYHKYQESTVEWAKRSRAPVLAVELEDGYVLHCTENHPLLVHPSGKPDLVWREAGKLLGTELIPRFLNVWNPDYSYESGYLAGFFDGEGSLFHNMQAEAKASIQMSFSQNSGLALDRVLSYIMQKNFRCNENGAGTSTARRFLMSGGKGDILRFLGTIKPIRLLDNLHIDKLGGFKSRYTTKSRISSITYMGEKEIVELQTSSGTYFTDGLGSHNSLFGLDGKVVMAKAVRPEFREVNAQVWKEAKASPVDTLIEEYRTEARWQKAVQHLNELGELVRGPQDIGSLIKEISRDVRAECEDEIKEKLFQRYWPEISRGVTRGFPEFYKQKLLDDSENS